MAIKEWSPNYTGDDPIQDADPITGAMPDLDDETALRARDGDEMRSSHVESLRDKLQAVCKMAGDSVNAPAGSVTEILDRDHATGDARQVRLAERTSAPVTVAGKHFLYAKDDGKAYVKRGDGSESELGVDTGGQTNTISGANGITNTGDNVDAVLSLVDMAQSTFKGRAAGAGTGPPTDLTAAQSTAVLDEFTDALKGLAPASGGGTTNYLRADGTWQSPPGGSSSPLTTKGDIWGYDTVDDRVPVGADNTVLTADSAEGLGIKYALVANASLATMAQATIKGRESGAGTGSPVDLTATQATAVLDEFTDSLKGLAPASGGGSTNFLRADGTWADPGGGGGGTLDRYIVFADDTEFGESGTSYVTKKTFRVVRDSAKKNSSWRLLVSLWIEGGGTSAECQLKVGATDAANVSSTETTETASAIKKIDLTVNESNEPENTFLDVDIDLKQTGGGTAKLKFTELYAIYT